MQTIVKNTTETEFCLQLQALSAEAAILEELGMDILARKAQRKVQELQSASAMDCDCS
ncbi:MAG: hypothetical protein ACK5LE_09895 [Alphaproteobacteria bacterium]